jgi:phospholipase C
MRRRIRWIVPVLAVAAAVMVASSVSDASGGPKGGSATTSPVKHLVVVFQENVSFDHYFGTYPNAANPPGEPAFHAAPDTPSVNGLQGALLTANPNGANPQRLDRSQALTCDQNHGYTAEQKAFDLGLMDKFLQYTDVESCSPPDVSAPNLVLDYYDGNTVTALWNYAQRFAMSDNSYSDTFGPSTPGALNVTAANTYGAICGPSSAVYNAPTCTATPGASPATPDSASAPGTVYSDADPNFDVCSSIEDHKTAAQTIQMSGQNIGDLLDKAGVTWGWFQGGFASPGYVPGKPGSDDLSAVCSSTHENVGGATQTDYNPHHEPFQYYASTANPEHLPPASVAAIGRQDQANHQYDLKDFWAAADSGNLPSVSYLKAANYQDGHAGLLRPARRTGIPRRHDRPSRAAADLEQHRGRDPLRRQRRLVRPPDRADPDAVANRAGRAHRHRHLRHEHRRGSGRSRRRARASTLRSRSSPAAARDLAVQQAERRRWHPDDAELGDPLHRGQLAGR